MLYLRPPYQHAILIHHETESKEAAFLAGIKIGPDSAYPLHFTRLQLLLLPVLLLLLVFLGPIL